MTFGFVLLTAGLVALIAGIQGKSIADVLTGAIGESDFWGRVKSATGEVTGKAEAYGEAADTPEPGGGRIYELFYDPLGAWKNGIRLPAIGGHRDHVHVAAPTSVVRALQSIARSRYNLTITEPVGEDSGGHARNSYHKRNMAFDASGSPDDMEAFAAFVRDNYVKKAAPRKRKVHGTTRRNGR